MNSLSEHCYIHALRLFLRRRKAGAQHTENFNFVLDVNGGFCRIFPRDKKTGLPLTYSFQDSLFRQPTNYLTQTESKFSGYIIVRILNVDNG